MICNTVLKRIHRRELRRLSPLQRSFTRLPTRVDYRRRAGAPHRIVALSNIQNVDGRRGLRRAHRPGESDLRLCAEGPDRTSGCALSSSNRGIHAADADGMPVKAGVHFRDASCSFGFRHADLRFRRSDV